MNAARGAIGLDFGSETRRAALADWRRLARATERGGLLTRHPVAASVAVGMACGLALALWRNKRSPRPPLRRSVSRNAGPGL